MLAVLGHLTLTWIMLVLAGEHELTKAQHYIYYYIVSMNDCDITKINKLFKIKLDNEGTFGYVISISR